MTTIGIAVIGCGDIARARCFPAIDKAPDFELRGVCNRTRAAGDAAVGRYGGKNHASLNDLLRAPDVDAVVIATPHPSHAYLIASVNDLVVFFLNLCRRESGDGGDSWAGKRLRSRSTL